MPDNNCAYSIIGWIVALIGIPLTYYSNKLLKRKEIEMDKISEIKEMGRKLSNDIKTYWAACINQNMTFTNNQKGITKELKTVGDYMDTYPYDLYNKAKAIMETIPMFPWDRWRLRHRFYKIVSIYEEIKDDIPKYKELPQEINVKLIRVC
jgi:hypothetical protein